MTLPQAIRASLSLCHDRYYPQGHPQSPSNVQRELDVVSIVGLVEAWLSLREMSCTVVLRESSFPVDLSNVLRRTRV